MRNYFDQILARMSDGVLHARGLLSFLPRGRHDENVFINYGVEE